MKLSFIFGTRPEAIKLAPLILAAKDACGLHPHICVTGQHRSMLDQVMQVFGIEPDVDLELMQANQSLASFSSNALKAIDNYLKAQQPDCVLVQGDTSTVLCAALAAYYNQIPVGHVEAGLRTGNGYSPFPEEMNRVLASQIATFHFAPTETARQHLLAAGIDTEKVFVTGNTIVDALAMATDLIQERTVKIKGIPDHLMDKGCSSRMVLITGHRRESFGAEFENICEAILKLAKTYEDVAFVYPVHLNPNVIEPAHRILAGQPNIYLIEPQGYLEFVALMDRSFIVLTDSGGIQEEAPSMGKPVLVMRETTERPEGIRAGVAKLVGTSQERIVDAVSLLLNDEQEYERMARAVNPYGDGTACRQIISVLQSVSEPVPEPIG